MSVTPDRPQRDRSPLKVVMMGSYSAYPHHRELGVHPSSIRRFTTWNENLVAGLTQLSDLEITFITRNAGKKRRDIRLGGNRIVYLAGSRLLNAATGHWWTALRAQAIIRQARPNLVHGIGTEHIWATVALMCSLPHAVTVHGVINSFNTIEDPPHLSRLRYFAALERRAFRKVSHVISISPYIQSLFQSLHQQATIYPIENAIGDEFFSVNARPPNSRRIIFVGDTSKNKGLLTLLQSLGRLKASGTFQGWSLDVVGPTKPSSNHDMVMEALSRHQLVNEVSFLGVQTPESLTALYAAAALLVLPSFAETAPVCIAEAMAGGLPVIASRIAGIPYMVDDGSTGVLVPPGEATPLAQAIAIMIQQPVLRAEMGQRGAQIARKRWRREHIAAQTADVYRRIVAFYRGLDAAPSYLQ